MPGPKGHLSLQMSSCSYSRKTPMSKQHGDEIWDILVCYILLHDPSVSPQFKINNDDEYLFIIITHMCVCVHVVHHRY